MTTEKKQKTQKAKKRRTTTDMGDLKPLHVKWVRSHCGDKWCVTKKSEQVVADIMTEINNRVIKELPALMASDKKSTLSKEHVSSALAFLAKNAHAWHTAVNKGGQDAVERLATWEKDHADDEKRPKDVKGPNTAKKAGLIVSPSRVRKVLKARRVSNKMSHSSSVYWAGANESILSDILKRTHDKAMRDRKLRKGQTRMSLVPNDLSTVVKEDEPYKTLLGGKLSNVLGSAIPAAKRASSATNKKKKKTAAATK